MNPCEQLGTSWPTQPIRLLPEQNVGNRTALVLILVQFCQYLISSILSPGSGFQVPSKQ